MANQETQLLDDIIVTSRRKMLALGLTSLAGMALAASPRSAKAQGGYTDSDILNFALNLEYLEANFYYLAAFGTTIDKPNAASVKAGGPATGIPITGSVGTAGTVMAGGTMVPFTADTTGTTIGSYATETAIEEGKHVLFLQTALGASTAVAQPAINLTTSFQMLAAAANTVTPSGNIPTNFSPYANETDFLIGAYVFEDVGVTAYHGAASLLTMSSNLSAAAGILAVEAYHAGLIRTTITAMDTSGALAGYTDSISALRSYLASNGLLGVAPMISQYDSQTGVPDDYGTSTFTTPTPLGTSGTAMATRIVDADPTNAIAFARNTTQVLNIVTGGGAAAAGATTATSPAMGVFFPAGLNAGPNGFK